jgi:predicted HTH domain antitoxin
MKTLTIPIPESVDVDNALIILSAQLYERGELSLGQAAEMAKTTKRKFAGSLGQYGVSLFNYPAADLKSDVSNA